MEHQNQTKKQTLPSHSPPPFSFGQTAAKETIAVPVVTEPDKNYLQFESDENTKAVDEYELEIKQLKRQLDEQDLTIGKYREIVHRLEAINADIYTLMEKFIEKSGQKRTYHVTNENFEPIPRQS